MVDQKTLAYINLYAVLGTLENLCELDPAASALLTNKKPIAIGFDVQGGPSATLTFKNGRCRLEQGIKSCDIKLPFSSCEKFNGLIDGTVTPIPTKGFTKIKFLLKDFTALTDLLNKYMRPDPADLYDDEFFKISTSLMFYTITVAISQIANNDKVGIFTANLIANGDIEMSIEGGPSATLRANGGRLVTLKCKPDNPRAVMSFASMKLARDLFDGNVNALECIGSGAISMKGLISMIDNLNRLLDRVAVYLA
ncbi:MAG TPA: hypothetical protein PKW24_04425 [Clostridiales bacterium]|nr:hypothetical protein [Clostridiales bacterium]